MPQEPFEPVQNLEQQNPAAKLSRFLDTLFRPVGRPLGAVLGGLGREATSLISPKHAAYAEETFQKAGEHLPRLALEFAATGAKRLPVKLAGLGDVLLRSSTQPGADIGTGLGETAAFALAPKVGGLASRAVQPIAQRAEQQFTSPIGKLLAGGVVRRPAALAGALVPFEGAAALEAYRRGQLKEHVEQLGSPEHIIGTAAGVLPFEAARIPGDIRAVRSALVTKTPVTENQPVFRVRWEAHETPRFRDFGSEDTARDFADEVRRSVGGEPVVEPAGTMPRDRTIYKMAFKPEQLQGPFGLTGVDLLNDPTKSALKMGVDKEGMLDAKGLIGRLKTVLPPAEFDIYEKAGLPAFLASKPKASPGEVQEWMTENGPRVEVRTLKSGEGAESERLATVRRRSAEAQHRMETLDPEKKYWDFEGRGVKLKVPFEQIPGVFAEELRGMVEEYNSFSREADEIGPVGETFDVDQYRSIAPKDADQTVVLVRVPRGPVISQREHAKLPIQERVRRTVSPLGVSREDVLFKGDHFGRVEDINVLGFARMQYEDVGGKKVANVIEVQSDWGQRYREAQKMHGVPDPENVVSSGAPKPHPLLKDYNRLVLKSAIDQALKDGAEKIVVSDAETAMMTEGHDLGAQRQFRLGGKGKTPTNWTNDIKKIQEYLASLPDNHGYEIEQRVAVTQEAGMRLNYDTILPKIMEELTGEKGKRVELGEHQKAFQFVHEEGFESREAAEARARQVNGRVVAQGPSGRLFRVEAGNEPRANLIFKNPDGTPKTSVTGLEYGLSKVQAELAKQGGFTLFGKGQFIRDHIARMELEGYTPEQMAASAEAIRLLKPLKGEDPLQTLARSVGIDPKVFSRLAPGESLERAFDFFASVFHHNFGETPERAAYLAKQVMTPLARFAPYLKQTAFAVAPESEGSAHLFTVPRPGSEVTSYLATLLPKASREKGVSPETLTFQIAWQAAHESAHNMGSEIMSPTGSATPEQLNTWVKSMASVESIPPGEREGVMRNILQLLVPPNRYNEVSKINMTRYEENPEEFLADFAAAISVGSLEPRSLRNMEDLMQFGDRASQNFSNAVYRDLTSMWGMVKDWLRVSLGYKPEPAQKAILNRVNAVYENLTKLLQTREKAEETFATFNAFMDRQTTGPLEPPPIVSAQQMHRLFERLDDLNAYASEAVGHVVKTSQNDMALLDTALSYLRPYESSERAAGERLSWYQRNWLPMVQFAESLKEKTPSAVPVKDLGFSYRGQVSDLQTNTWKLWATPAAEAKARSETFFGALGERLSGGIDWKRLRWLSKDGTPQQKALTKITLSMNVLQQEKGVNTLPTRAEKEAISSEYKGLSDADKEKVDASIEQGTAMYKFMAKKQWDAFRDRQVRGLSKVLMSWNKNMFHDKAYDLAKEAVDLEYDVPFNAGPEEQLVFAQRRVNFMESLPIPQNGHKIFVDAVKAGKEPWSKLGDQLLGPVGPDGERPGRNYWPEVRTREWHVNWKLALEAKPHHEAYNTEVEAVAKKKAVEKAHSDEKGNYKDLEYIHSFNRKDRTERYRGLVQEEISSVQQDALDALKKTILSAISREHPEAKDIVKQIEAELQPSTAFANIAVSPYMRKREFIPGRENLNMAEGLLRYVDAVAYQIAKRHVKQAGQAVLFNPDMRANPDVRNKMEGYLRFVTDSEGQEFNLLRNLVFFNYIGFNPSTMLVEWSQQLVTLVPYLVENGMAPREAYKKLRDVNGLLLPVNVGRKKELDNPLHNRALKEAEDSRVVDTGFTADLYGEGDVDFAGQRSNILGNGAIGETADLLKRGLYHMLAVARKSYAWSTTANARAALITSFDYAYGRSKAKEPEARYREAYDFAKQATEATMFGGGRANRPMALQGWGKMSGIGGVMYTLGSYTLNTMTMMARLTRKAIQAQLKDPKEVAAATKAAGVMWATQFALGGILGLPLVAAGVAVLEKVFPGLDARKAMREGLVNLAGEDEDLGHYIADGSMRGLLNLSSVDFGSRFQLGGLLGVSPYDGFSWRNVFGPAATMLENWKNSVSQASEGKWGDAVRTSAPVSVKNVLQLVHDDWGIRDKTGRLIAELTPAEKFLAGIGFKPKKLTQHYEQQAMLERSENKKARDVRDLRSEVAKLIAGGDVQGAQRRIIEGLQEVGPYDPLDMVREAAELAQEMRTPTPLRAGSRANLAEASEIAGLYPRGVTQSERQRVLRRALLIRQLGFSNGRPSIQELRVASMVDQYIKQNPRASVAEARAAIEKRSRAGRRREATVGRLALELGR